MIHSIQVHMSRMQQLHDFIDRQPAESIEMESWCSVGNNPALAKKSLHLCGTTYCLAGFASVLADKKSLVQYSISSTATNWLFGDSYVDDHKLFYVNDWPARYRNRYESCGATENDKRKKVVLAFLK